jgi:hypothetical protein
MNSHHQRFRAFRRPGETLLALDKIVDVAVKTGLAQESRADGAAIPIKPHRPSFDARPIRGCPL